MNLRLTVVAPDTFLVTPAEEEALETPGSLILHHGELHEGIPHATWARFVGRQVDIHSLEAFAAANHRGVAEGAPADAAGDIPAAVRDFLRCPCCGSALESGTLSLTSSSSRISRLLTGPTFEEMHTLQLEAGGASLHLMGTGQRAPAMWCAPCGLVQFRVRGA